MDRIDIHIEVPNLGNEILHTLDETDIENSYTIRQRVIAAQDLQMARCGKLNNFLSNTEMSEYCQLSADIRQIMEKAAKRFNLSASSLFRIIKVSRTIADLDSAESIEKHHVTEGLSFRSHGLST